eukprot:122868_1
MGSNTSTSLFAIQIDVDIVITNSSFSDSTTTDKLVIDFVYREEQKMKQLFDHITNHLNQRYHPATYRLRHIQDGSFTGAQNPSDLHNKSITEYNMEEIKAKGLIVFAECCGRYRHQVSNVSITCPEMKRWRSTDAKKCSVYRGMNESYKFSAENLYHLEQFTHFTDEYGAKTACRYKDECNAYKRLENGGNRLEDKCHMKIYRHPPRKRNIQLQKNVHALIMNKSDKENHETYGPTPDDDQRYNYNPKDGYLRALMEEVRANGFGSDLCLECGVNDECKHGEEHSILKIVDQKMNSHRHKQMGKPLTRDLMLSLILYTGCECNFDLCASQRHDDYNKWKWFDYCLYEAIW